MDLGAEYGSEDVEYAGGDSTEQDDRVGAEAQAFRVVAVPAETTYIQSVVQTRLY